MSLESDYESTHANIKKHNPLDFDFDDMSSSFPPPFGSLWLSPPPKIRMSLTIPARRSSSRRCVMPFQKAKIKKKKNVTHSTHVEGWFVCVCLAAGSFNTDISSNCSLQ